MSNYFDLMKKELDQEKTLTENGAVAYRTPGKELLGYHFHVSAYRKRSAKEIVEAFIPAYYEDKKNALPYIFYLGDVREGLGERHQFRSILEYLADSHKDIARAIIANNLVPEYNRWDSLWVFLAWKDLRADVINVVKKQLIADATGMNENKPISLLAKWMPSENASSAETKRKAKILREGLGLSSVEYRKTLSKLRAYLDVVERKMSAKQWSEINYEAVPSRANLIYNNAFLRNDEDRRRGYLESLQKGETKINSGVLQPHEIVNKYSTSNGWYFSRTLKPYDVALEEMWKALPSIQIENTLVVRDGSGSMTSPAVAGSVTPLDVATALAIYSADHNTGIWKGNFVTFSSRPKIVNLVNCDSLRDKMQLCYRESECANTDIYATMKLILDTAVNNGLTQEEMPGTILIISDMQFDGRAFNFGGSLFDNISAEYEAHGYHLPKICFWNLVTYRSDTIPMQENKYGLVLMSGFSVHLLKMAMSNKTDPYEVLLETLDSSRYDKVREAVKGLV